MKMDLVMWTKNSQKTLVPCLKSIDRVIPKEAVNKKIIVDGHSTDKTEEIAKKFNWEFHKAEKTGISYQANQGWVLWKRICLLLLNMTLFCILIGSLR
jgi:glycosyltransferase involved in cell wall biosynthesis